MKRIFFVFLGAEDLKEEAIRTNSIPSGFYYSQDSWNGESWDTKVYYEGTYQENSSFLEARKLKEGEYIFS